MPSVASGAGVSGGWGRDDRALEGVAADVLFAFNGLCPGFFQELNWQNPERTVG
jgi:hypothetical protein